MTSPDSELVEASHVRLKHAKELLDVDATQFMYSGEVSMSSQVCFLGFLVMDILILFEVPIPPMKSWES